MSGNRISSDLHEALTKTLTKIRNNARSHAGKQTLKEGRERLATTVELANFALGDLASALVMPPEPPDEPGPPPGTLHKGGITAAAHTLVHEYPYHNR